MVLVKNIGCAILTGMQGEVFLLVGILVAMLQERDKTRANRVQFYLNVNQTMRKCPMHKDLTGIVK
jgi:hypothetical protein